jgi:uncharacterized DUF497 family protein
LRWEWDEEKNQKNRSKHGLDFETAALVFDDPLAVSRPDSYPHEERWHTIGGIGSVIILVVHTYPRYETKKHEEVGRIISARKATKQERRAYEEGTF